MEMQKVRITRLTLPRITSQDLRPGDPNTRSCRSIEEFGFLEPLVVNKRTGNIISGHQRIKVLKEKGVTEIEVVVVDFSIEKKRQLI